MASKGGKIFCEMFYERLEKGPAIKVGINNAITA